MKAVRIFGYGDESVLEYGEAPEPVPGPGEVLIEVRAASVSPADWKIRKGELQKFFPLEFPAILGRDGAGVVMDLGASVDGAAIGDEVCFIVPRGGQGPYAERVVVPAGLLAPKPGNIDFADAAAFPLAGLTAWAALVDTAPVGPGVKVLVHGGAGGVGGMAVQLGRHFGAEVAATCSDANVDYVRDLGASQVVAYDRQDFVALVEGCDVVFDTVGGDVHRRSYEVLKPGGVLVYVIADPIEDLSAEHRRRRQAARPRRAGGDRRHRASGRHGAAARPGRRGAPAQRHRPRPRQDRPGGRLKETRRRVSTRCRLSGVLLGRRRAGRVGRVALELVDALVMLTAPRHPGVHHRLPAVVPTGLKGIAIDPLTLGHRLSSLEFRRARRRTHPTFGRVAVTKPLQMGSHPASPTATPVTKRRDRCDHAVLMRRAASRCEDTGAQQCAARA
jgi:NADPH:quinone reductase-like Zn-dependent oxidoreductase